MSPTDLTVREYDATDRPFLAWAVRGSSRVGRPAPSLSGDDRWTRWVADTADELHRHSRDPDWVILLAEWRGSRVGLVAGRRVRDAEGATPRPAARGPVGTLVELYVDSWYWGMGIGRALLEATELTLQGLGCQWLAPLPLPAGPGSESARAEFGLDERWERAGHPLPRGPFADGGADAGPRIPTAAAMIGGG